MKVDIKWVRNWEVRLVGKKSNCDVKSVKIWVMWEILYWWKERKKFCILINLNNLYKDSFWYDLIVFGKWFWKEV